MIGLVLLCTMGVHIPPQIPREQAILIDNQPKVNRQRGGKRKNKHNTI